jgi:hypothetical protein
VELVDGYERFGDAANGPLQPGERGAVFDVQEGPNGERYDKFLDDIVFILEYYTTNFNHGRHSIRIIHNLRKWWYQPQALIREKSGLIDSPAVWFLSKILRAHGYEQSTLQLLTGQQALASTWQVGDIVSPTKMISNTKSDEASNSRAMEINVGCIVPENSTSTSSLTARGRESGSVLVEYISKDFARAVGVQAQGGSALLLESKRVSVSRLTHSSKFYHLKNSGNKADTEMEVVDPNFVLKDPAINNKILADIKKLPNLDLAAIENVTTECQNNSIALAIFFSVGLPAYILQSLDNALEKIKQFSDDETLPQSISALGNLAIVIAGCLFPENLSSQQRGVSRKPSTKASIAIGGNDRGSAIQRSLRSEARREMRSERQLPRSNRSGPVLSHERRLSAIEQRRNMYLSLMSRARRNQAPSSRGSIVPSFDPFGQNAADLLFRNPGAIPEEDWSAVARGADEETASVTVQPNVSNHEESTSSPLLDKILRGRVDKKSSVSTGRNASGQGSIPSTVLKTAINNGLLGNSLPWLQTSLHPHKKTLKSAQSTGGALLLQSTVDEDGTPLLQLAISLGCSVDIIRYLIRSGTPVGEKEIEFAVRYDQADSLRLLLKNTLYYEGMVDLTSSSLSILKALEEASSRQKSQHKAMQQEAKSFFLSCLRKLVILGRHSRHFQHTTDLCSRSVAGAITGDVIFSALERKQLNSSSKNPQTNEQKEGVLELPDTVSRGLLHALPDEFVGEALVASTNYLTSFLLLIEDYLCSKEINDSAIGLTLLLTLVEKFPSFCFSSEVERYGFAELAASHDAFASNKLADLSSRVTVSREEASKTGILAASGVVCCPKRHAASLHVTKHSSFRCDLCGKGVECNRFMHGCRECDWDACERCTDKGEGGVVKWTYVRELASECLSSLSQGASDRVSDSDESSNRWSKKMTETLASLSNSSEVNNLSIRLLQRDCESLEELRSMLYIPGKVTMHQFLGVILPALHVSLLGRPNGIRRSALNDVETFRCRKKQRVYRSDSPKVVEPFYSDSEKDKLYFAREVLRIVVHNDDESALEERSIQSSDNEDGSSEDEAENEDERKDTMPELLRRLHQVLSLYENVATLPNIKHHDLQSLNKPLQICLLPATSRKQRQGNSRFPTTLSIQAEPLMSAHDLSMHVLRTCKVTNPIWLSFCRR